MYRNNLFMRLFLITIIFSIASYAQDSKGYKMCLALQGNNLSSNRVAENALNRILDVSGLSKNFILYPCNDVTEAAIALTYKGDRYIFYNTSFMNSVNSNLNDWANLFVLAHEVGHHVNGHTKELQLYIDGEISEDSKYKNRQQELEADEWAGFVISKLGASMNSWKDVKKLISAISIDGDDSQSTHPNKTKRLIAAQRGYNKGKKFSQNRSSSKTYNTKTSNKNNLNIYLPKEGYQNAPRSFWFKEKRYQSYNIFSRGGFKDVDLGLLKNGGGLLRIVPYGKSYVNGTLQIYLSNGDIIKCYDKGFKEVINYDRVTYYYLTKSEILSLLDPKITVDEIKFKEGETLTLKKNPLSIYNEHIGQLRIQFGIITRPNNNNKKSENVSNKSNNNKLDWNYETMGPRRSDYITYNEYLEARRKWTNKKNINTRSYTSSVNTYKTNPNNKSLNKKKYSDSGFVLGVGYLEGVSINAEGYLGDWSIGIRSTFYNENDVVNTQGVLGYKLINFIYLKASVGVATNINSIYFDDLETPFIDYTSYSIGLSFYRNGEKVLLSPEIIYDFQKKTVGGMLSISF